MVRNALIAAAIMLAALFALFVWPTPYSYYNTNNGILVRVNRVTQQAVILITDRWEYVTYGGPPPEQIPLD